MAQELYFPLSGVKYIDDAAMQQQKHRYFALGKRLGFSALELEKEAVRIYHLQKFEELSLVQLEELSLKMAKKFFATKKQEQERLTHIHKWVCECGDRLFVQLSVVKGV